MLKIGVLGVGHLGKIHLKCINMIQNYQLIGFFDPNTENAQHVADEFKIPAYDDIEQLIDAVDVVDIVTPTIQHFVCASAALKKNKHVFIEKPIVATPEEARQLAALAHQSNVKMQVGHVERFNPAFLAAESFIQHPMFIEAHRLAPFNPRGIDVPVVLDLMIHDIDIVLHVVKSNVIDIQANGVNIISKNNDITNARLEFENGCVANLTASRISMKNMRKARFFQPNAYISVDFLEKKTEIIRMKELAPDEKTNPFALIMDLENGSPRKQIFIENPEIQPINAIQTELEKFSEAIIYDKIPTVTLKDGCQALDVAYRILDEAQKNLLKSTKNLL
ncbi:MAG: Gfo/Idh/MocA family oxidoreductase [Bacteroidales bacterium]|nr:Gfo/Idh/MocA family oxidoreductase [Bacteroidales bacterium]